MILQEYSVIRKLLLAGLAGSLVLLILVGCSSQKELTPDVKQEPVNFDEIFPREAVDHVIIAALYEAQGDYVMAVHQYNQALLHDSTSATLYINVAENYLRLGEYDSARLVIDRAIRKLGMQRDLMKTLGEILFDSRLTVEAINTYEKVVELFPDDGEAWRDLGTLNIQIGNDTRAIECYDKAQEIDGPDSDLMLRQVTLYSMQDDLDGALKVYAELFELNPDDSQIPFSMGGLYLEKGDSTTADSMFALTVEMEPHVIDYWLLRIQLANAVNDSSKAIQLVDKGLKKNPDDLELLGLAGALLMTYQMYDNAEKYMLRAAELDTAGIVHLSNLGYLYHETERWNKAEDVYKEALKLAPEDAQLLNNYAYMLAEKGERFEEAMTLIDKALEAEPDNPSFLDTKGWLLYLLNDYEQALTFIEKASGLDSSNPEIIEHLNDVYKALGK